MKLRTILMKVAIACVCLSSGLVPTALAQAPRADIAVRDEAVLYLSPDGSDGNDGRSPPRALATLQQAQRVLAKLAPLPPKAEIRVGPGTYFRQAVVWTWLPKSTAIRIAAAAPGGRPVFDGVSNDTNWFEVRGGRGEPTHISIEGLRIVNYLTAIWFHGDRERLGDRWTGGNRIVDNVFEDIGARQPGKSSAFALEFVNSRDNVVSGNTFRNIVSVTACGSLHSIYLAHGASNNLMEKNTFDGGCGATISLRDASNHNVVRNNVFRAQTGNALVLDWYCHPRGTAACTKKTPECPSWETVFAGNTIHKGSNPATEPVLVYHDDRANECVRPAGAQLRARSDRGLMQK